MVKIISKLKSTNVIKKIRVKKWLYLNTTKYLFPTKIVVKAENDNEAKRKYVYKWLSKFPEKKIELDNKINMLFSEAEMSQEIKEDIYFCYFAYGFSVNEYISYALRNKSTAERREYLSDRDSVKIGYAYNDLDASEVFRDKFLTYEKFKQYFHRDAILINSSNDFCKFLDFVKKHDRFVTKIVNEACGRSVCLIDLNDAKLSEEQLFQKLLSDGRSIIEELVIQDDDIALFNPSSVNTIRCITMNTSNGIFVPFCFFKVGRKGSFIDNGGAGGILIGIDENTGVLNTDGVDEKGIRYQRHPDSEVYFIGYQLPAWEECKRICVQMANSTPNVKIIGWDMAYTKFGWVVIEGNAMTEVIGPQATRQHGIRKDFYQYLKMM